MKPLHTILIAIICALAGGLLVWVVLTSSTPAAPYTPPIITTSTPDTPVRGCTKELKICPDGTGVGRSGPNCEFAACPDAPTPTVPPADDVVFCTQDVQECPDGSFVGRVAPDCNFAACPSADMIACTMEAMLCPDGVTYVGRTGPNCEFTPCP
jgi:hypothetical protein